MSNQKEQEWTLTTGSGQKIVRVEIVNDGYGIKYYTIPKLKNEFEEIFEEMFPIIDIENLSLTDKFMQYEPKTDLEQRIKESIIEAKRIGMKNFRIPAMDPSLDEDGETIIYCEGREPAVGKSPIWWYENAPKFLPHKNSRIRDDLEHDVVLGMQIKELIETRRYKVADAWKALCVNSTLIGHYRGRYNDLLMLTGHWQVGKFSDLGNTYKIVKKRGDLSFLSYGCCFDYGSIGFPFAIVHNIDDPYNGHWDSSVGELALDV